ncbi:MAG TPA: tetratricopeptide repeat protein [Candidatus Acidoferrum sp.]|nr:tetratricopeptide repeat protein [Candidatus Acidoferrum sp.]
MNLKTLQTVPPHQVTQRILSIGPGDYRTVLGVCLFLLGAVWLVFGQTLGHGFVNYDDEGYVYGKTQVIHGLNLKGIEWAFTHSVMGNWHPLTVMSHMLDCQFYGVQAGGHHLTSLLLHAATAILLFLVLREMTGALWRSAFVAAVFAVHPLRVESVVWVSERKDVLSGLFFMLTLGAYVRYVRKSPSLSRYLMVMLPFALGLMCKPMLVTMPFVLLLLDYWPLNRMANLAEATVTDRRDQNHFPIPRRLNLEKLPLFGLAVAACVITLFAQTEAIQPFEQISIPLRVGNALISYVTYLSQMFWPSGLAVLYPLSAGGVGVSKEVLSSVVLAGISTGVFFLRHRAYLLTGWLWYLVMLVPVIGIVQVGGQARADRYTYLPQIGLYLLLTWAAADLCAGWRYRRVILASGSAVIVTALILCARVQTSYWRNSESLWTHTLLCTSDNWLGQNNLGNALLKKRNLDEAIAHFQKALQLVPDNAEVYYNLGDALLKKGSVDEAIANFQRALKIKPDYVEAHNNLGNALFKKGSVDEAIVHFQRALQIKPDYAEVRNNLDVALAKAHDDYATTLVQMGRDDEAIIEFREALELFPDFADARHDLAVTLLHKGQVNEAIAQFREIQEKHPDDAMASFDLGNAWFQKGDMDEAAVFYQRALQINPDDVSVRNNLGMALLRKGMVDEAVVQFRKTLALQPDFTLACTNLNKALLQKEHP